MQAASIAASSAIQRVAFFASASVWKMLYVGQDFPSNRCTL